MVGPGLSGVNDGPVETMGGTPEGEISPDELPPRLKLPDLHAATQALYTRHIISALDLAWEKRAGSAPYVAIKYSCQATRNSSYLESQSGQFSFAGGGVARLGRGRRSGRPLR